MALERKEYPDIAPAGPTYSRAVKAGNTLYISGCTARGSDAQGKSMMAQLDVTLGRLLGVAAAEGAGPGSFAKLTCFVTSIADYQLARKAFAEPANSGAASPRGVDLARFVTSRPASATRSPTTS